MERKVRVEKIASSGTLGLTRHTVHAMVERISSSMIFKRIVTKNLSISRVTALVTILGLLTCLLATRRMQKRVTPLMTSIVTMMVKIPSPPQRRLPNLLRKKAPSAKDPVDETSSKHPHGLQLNVRS
jgi:hypothetical protein